MNFCEKIFKANDIRGVYGEELDEDAAHAVGRALAANAPAGRLALARDGRLSSPALAEAAKDGMQASGARVLDLGIAPTPALYFAAWEFASGSGMMITGSHNPSQHNGMKMMLNGSVLGGAQARDLVNRLAESPADARSHGSEPPLPDAEEARERYFEAATQATGKPARPLHLVVDAGNGATGEYAPALLRRLGHRVSELFCEIDGSFPNHHPDPAQPENLQDARYEMARQGADAALVFDGDGDRLGVLLPGDDDWVFPDRLLMLLARDVLLRHPGSRIVFDVKCSAQLAPWIKKYGGEPDMQPTGHAFIKKRMAETGAILGGEMSGHFYFAENWRGFDDALLAGAKIAAVFAQNPKAMTDIPRAAASPEIVVDIGGRDGKEIIREFARRVKFPGAEIIDIDGVRAEFDDGFGLVRASNTTPSLVLRFEGATENALDRITGDFRRALADIARVKF